MREKLSAIFLMGILFINQALAESPPTESNVEEGVTSDQSETGSKTDTQAQSPANAFPGADAFCESIIDPAREHRYLLKKQELETLLSDVNKRIDELNKRRAEHEEWIRRREEFAKRATANLVEIYSNMKPEAAASRLTELNQELAASLLLAISPRQASAILNEIDEEVAAQLTGIMSASARSKDPS